MATNSQPQSNAIPTAAKLSSAQVRCLETMEQGPRPLPLSAKAETQRMKKLMSIGLVDTLPTNDIECPEYFLTLDGQETLRAFNGTLPEVEPVQTAEAAPANIPLLPATTLPRPAASNEAAPVIAETRTLYYNTDGLPEVDDMEEGPVYNDDDIWFLPPARKTPESAPVIAETPAPCVGDTVLFRYFLDPLVGQEEFEGRIDDAKEDRLCGWMYYIVPTEAQTTRFNLAPRWLAARYIKAIVTPAAQTNDLYQAMKQAEEMYKAYARLDTFDLPADHATYKRKVAAHITFLRAQAAYLGTSNEHLIAYLYGKGAVTKTAAQEWPEIAPVMPVEGDTPRLFAPYKPVEQDPQILAAKRQAQYEAAKARVEAIKNGAPVPPLPSPAPKAPSACLGVFPKPRRPMTAEEQANEDALQAMIAASRKAN